MNLNLSIPQNIENVQPKISVIGVGGAGCNAVNTMINSKVNNINFLVANTDGQALSRSMAKTQIQLVKNLPMDWEQVLITLLENKLPMKL